MKNKFQQPELSDYQRGKLIEHAMAALQAQQQIQEAGGVHQLMMKQAEAEGFTAWQHYPKGDRIDYESGGQYYYHCHRENFETEEHGHFHCFLRKKGNARNGGWPISYKIADIPEKEKYLNSPMTHLITIGLNRYGLPIRLFTVNRWVTKETWFEAEKMHKLRKRFDLKHVKAREGQLEQWRVVDEWIEHLIHLFAAQIDWLISERDKAMAEHIKQIRDSDNHYDDKRIEELSALDISLEAQVGWLMA